MQLRQCLPIFEIHLECILSAKRIYCSVNELEVVMNANFL